MPVTPFDITALPVADAAKARAASKSIHQAARIDFGSSAPFVQQRLQQLDDRVSGTYEAFAEKSASVQSSLQNLNLTRIAEDMRSIKMLASQSEAQKATSLDLLMTEAQRSLKKALAAVTGQAQVLHDGVSQVRDFKAPDIAQLLQEATARATLSLQKTKDKQMRHDREQDAITAITEALEAFKRYKLEDVFHELLPSAHEIEAGLRSAKTAGVDGELIKLAVAKVEQHIEVIGGVRKFKELEARREELRKQGLETKRLLRTLSSNAEQDREYFDSLSKVPLAWQSAAEWVVEVNKVLGVYTAFLGLKLDLAVKDPANFEAILTDCQHLDDFIEDLPRLIER